MNSLYFRDYCGGGHAKQIVTQTAEDSPRYHVQALEHNMKGQLWLARAFTCALDLEDEEHPGRPVAIEGLRVVEYRYDADGARYLERVRDATDVDAGEGYRAAYGPAAQENTVQ